jgi:ribose transport system substrate-binding protein
LLLVALVAVVCTGCGRTAPGTEGPSVAPKGAAPGPAAGGLSLKGKRIGVSLLNKQHVFYQDLERAMRAEATKLGAEIIVESAEFDAKQQDDQVDNFIVQKVDAMILCPADSASVGGAVKKANAAGIPVFTADIAAKEGDVVSHIASDNKLGGRLAAQYLAKALGDKGTVIIIDHPAVVSVTDRTAGFDEEMAKHPGIKIIGRPPAEGQRSKARDVMENMLMAHPDLSGVFAINDDTALGALAACRAHKGGDKIIIVGFDATPEALAEVMGGSQIKADVAQHPVRMGVTTIDTIARYFAKEKVEQSIPIAVDVLDKALLEKMKAEGKLKQIKGQWSLVEE